MIFSLYDLNTVIINLGNANTR